MLTFFVILILEWDIDKARTTRSQVFDETQYIFDDRNFGLMDSLLMTLKKINELQPISWNFKRMAGQNS